jgi:hypothetical protein
MPPESYDGKDFVLRMSVAILLAKENVNRETEESLKKILDVR